MKNLFKFGFLGLFITLGAASCGNPTSSETEEKVDSLEAVIESEIDAAVDSLEAIGDSVEATVDSVAAAL